ncbi:MAG: sulfotransferase [bacterium]
MNIGDFNRINKKNKIIKRRKKNNRIYKNIHNKAKPVFVLSTGRVGTKFLTKVISNSEKINSYHEPTPELIYYARYAYENQSLNEELKRIIDAARLEYILYSTINNKLYFESNNRITFFANQLEQLYPKAKFIHIVRHPGAFVRSGIRRKWYSNNQVWDMGRIVPFSQDIKWEEMSLISKISWLWNETNKFVETFKNEIPAYKILTIKSEDLFDNHNTINKIFRFIDVKNPYSRKEIKNLLNRPVNAQKINEFPKYKNWSKQQKEELRKYSNLAKKYNYNI